MSQPTGDVLLDTYNAMLQQRYKLITDGPQTRYSVFGQSFDREGYMRYLDKAIEGIKREMAQRDPVEELGIII